MPEVRKRGYSWWNPSTNSEPNTSKDVPRLFKTRESANRCIGQWAIGQMKEHTSTDWEGYSEVDLRITFDGRKKEDLEVVPVLLMEYKQ